MNDSAGQTSHGPITFARHGASAVEAPASRAAFELGQRLGASGVDSAVWFTADQVPVVHHDGYLRQRLRRVPIRRLDAAMLPAATTTLTALFDLMATPFDLVLDIEGERSVGAVLDAVRAQEDRTGKRFVDRVWLRHSDWQLLASLRDGGGGMRLVHRTRRGQLSDGPERHAARLGSAGVDAVEMPYPDWTGGLVVLFRRFEVLSFASNAEHARMINDLRGMEVDAISTRHPDRFAE